MCRHLSSYTFGHLSTVLVNFSLQKQISKLKKDKKLQAKLQSESKWLLDNTGLPPHLNPKAIKRRHCSKTIGIASSTHMHVAIFVKSKKWQFFANARASTLWFVFITATKKSLANKAYCYQIARSLSHQSFIRFCTAFQL